MRRTLLCGALVALTACGSAATEATSSTTPETVPSSSTTTSSTTTTMAPTTTSTMPPTTTTMAPTTTTTLMEGNFAALPLIVWEDWEGIALGWWDGSAWIQAEEETELPVGGGETYQVALLGSEAILEGGPSQNLGCSVVLPEGLPGVQFNDGNALYTVIDDGRGGERSISGVAISAPWDITPHAVGPGESHPDFEAMAAHLLRERGFSIDAAWIVQAVDADIDGDGALETFFVAEETELANEASGVYSMVIAVSPSWEEPVVVVESVIPADETGFPGSFRVSSVADLSGDGQMEVVVSGLAWENSWVTVNEFADAEFEERLLAGCGA